MENFSCISDIRLEDQSSWQGKTFLTFDIDWAEDFVIEPLIKILEAKGVKATWFVTHYTPLLQRLHENPNFELGIHPNFNNLLNGNDNNSRNSKEVIQKLLALIPQASSVRSHSMCQSSVLIELFHEFGITHDCNSFIPFRSQIECKPWLHWNGMVKVPYFWEDDIETTQLNKFDLSLPKGSRGLKVFDFHPIHIFLNTEDLYRYEISRPSHRDISSLSQYINFDTDGTLNALNELIS